MRQRDKQASQSAEETVRDIRRATRRHFSAEDKIRIVLEGLRGEAAGDKAAGTERSGSAPRVQITEEKRTNIHQAIVKERNVNRVTNVNFSINIGTRVPRSVRLKVLPASVITIVPEYRGYRYFVVDDQICIVEPSTYEVVEAILNEKPMFGRDADLGSRACCEQRVDACLYRTSGRDHVIDDEAAATGYFSDNVGDIRFGPTASVPHGI